MFKKTNEDLGVRNEKKLVWVTPTVTGRAGAGFQVFQPILGGHLALGELSRKTRLAQVDWGWVREEEGDTSDWLPRCTNISSAQRK